MPLITIALQLDLADYFSEVGFDGDVILTELGKYWSGKAVEILNEELDKAFKDVPEVKVVAEPDLVTFPPQKGCSIALRRQRTGDRVPVRIFHGSTDLVVLDVTVAYWACDKIREAYERASSRFDTVIIEHYQQMLGTT